MTVKHSEVLGYLRPNGNYVSVGKEYEGITFLEGCEPFTKAEYLAAFDVVADLKTQAQAQKQAILDRLGLTEDELRIVLS